VVKSVSKKSPRSLLYAKRCLIKLRKAEPSRPGSKPAGPADARIERGKTILIPKAFPPTNAASRLSFSLNSLCYFVVIRTGLVLVKLFVLVIVAMLFFICSIGLIKYLLIKLVKLIVFCTHGLKLLF